MMLGRLLLVLAALVVVPTALAAYPSPYAAQGGEGLASNDGAFRYVALKAGEKTTINALRRDGTVAKSQLIAGQFGIPMITVGVPGGMFRDGSTFVVQSVQNQVQTDFQLLGTGDLSIRDTISLPGSFSFDALSPDSKVLYLIQHRQADDIEHYIVRAYDLAEHSLRPGRIADKTQKSWVMKGWPATRASTADGRWVYTLYVNTGGYPFVHALDTVNGVAHCVGFAWPRSSQNAVFDFKLHVKGDKLNVRTNTGLLWRVIDRKTWKVTKR